MVTNRSPRKSLSQIWDPYTTDLLILKNHLSWVKQTEITLYDI